jgi:hypothetical protein
MRFTENYFGFVQPKNRDVFVETGSEVGESINFALKAGWGTVHSIDCCERNYESVCKRFRDDGRVHLYLGSSPVVLGELVRGLCDSTLLTTFWLDAHFQGVSGDEQIVGCQCPLLDELKVIFDVRWVRDPVVLIDDAHAFKDVAWPFKCPVGKQGFVREGWPLLNQVVNLFPPQYTVRELEDVLICRS